MKLYLVSEGSYSDCDIKGIFNTLERAEQAVESLLDCWEADQNAMGRTGKGWFNRMRARESYDINELTLNEVAEEDRLFWDISINDTTGETIARTRFLCPSEAEQCLNEVYFQKGKYKLLPDGTHSFCGNTHRVLVNGMKEQDAVEFAKVKIAQAIVNHNTKTWRGFWN